MNVWRLFVAGFAMMQVMMYALPAYLEPVPQIDGDLTPDIDHLLKLASLAITIPVMIFSAWPFFQAAIRDIRNRHVGMDIPVSVGIIVTFVASFWATFSGDAVYYDSLIMFVFLLLAARMIQSRVHNKSTSALRMLTQLLPLLAEKLPEYPANMRVEQINASELAVGDIVLIQAGAKIPVDGVVISGMSECDEHLILIRSSSHDAGIKVASETISRIENNSSSLECQCAGGLGPPTICADHHAELSKIGLTCSQRLPRSEFQIVVG